MNKLSANIEVQTRIYDHMIAGSFLDLKANIEEMVVKIAGSIFLNDRIHMLTIQDGGNVYYLAAPSRYITCAEKFSTPLAMALPGHPSHQGDGAYLLSTTSLNLGVIKRNDDFFLSRDPLEIERIAHEHGLPIHQIDAGIEPWPLEAAYARYRGIIGRATQRVARIAGYTIAACATFYAMIVITQAIAAHIPSWLPSFSKAEAVKQFQYTSPLSEQLAHFQKISSTVVRAGGWIDGYIWKAGQGEAFEITLPGWISHDYIDALGPDTIADYAIADNLVIAKKGDLERMSKP